MAAADPARRKLASSIAADTSWARTANRSERTAPARRRTPVQFEYWLDKVRAEHPDLNPAQQRAMATNAWRAQQKSSSLAAAKAREAKRDPGRRPAA
jgi:hypothetical protein